MASIAETWTTFLDKVTPYVKAIVAFFIPIYITIGTYFAIAGSWVVNQIPVSDLTNYTWAYVVGGIFMLLGIILGVITDPERKKD